MSIAYLPTPYTIGDSTNSGKHCKMYFIKYFWNVGGHTCRHLRPLHLTCWRERNRPSLSPQSPSLTLDLNLFTDTLRSLLSMSSYSENY